MFHTDDEFLRAVEADPRERTLRLAYADWLTERDDPRGELIRVEEEMRTLPVFADRFWSLKPRRNELRAVAGEAWCGRMRYGTEAEPVFAHGIPDGWHARWRLIREFTERWHCVPMPDVGGRQKEIAEAEARLGRTLPPSVREWVAFAHDHAEDEQFSDIRNYECHMVELPGRDAVSLRRRGGLPIRVYLYVARHDDLSNLDPVVRCYRQNYSSARDDAFVPDPDSAAVESLSATFLNEELGGCRGAGCFWTDANNPARLLRDLDSVFGVRHTVESTHIYETDNVLVRVTGTHGKKPSARIHVTVTRPVFRKEFPDFLWRLWDHTQRRGGYYGDIEAKP